MRAYRSVGAHSRATCALTPTWFWELCVRGGMVHVFGRHHRRRGRLGARHPGQGAAEPGCRRASSACANGGSAATARASGTPASPPRYWPSASQPQCTATAQPSGSHHRRARRAPPRLCGVLHEHHPVDGGMLGEDPPEADPQRGDTDCEHGLRTRKANTECDYSKKTRANH